MPRPRLRCKQCLQFDHKRGKCFMGFGECRGPDSIAAEECCAFLTREGEPAFLRDEDEAKQLDLF